MPRKLTRSHVTQLKVDSFPHLSNYNKLAIDASQACQSSQTIYITLDVFEAASTGFVQTYIYMSFVLLGKLR